MAPKLAWLRSAAVPDRGAVSPAGQLPRRAADRRPPGDRSGAGVDDHAVRAGHRAVGAVPARRVRRHHRRAAPRGLRPTCEVAEAASPPTGARLTGLRVGTRVAVGTGDDFAAPLGAGIVAPGPILMARSAPPRSCGAVARTQLLDPAAEPMVETHAGFPTRRVLRRESGLDVGRRRALGHPHPRPVRRSRARCARRHRIPPAPAASRSSRRSPAR